MAGFLTSGDEHSACLSSIFLPVKTKPRVSIPDVFGAYVGVGVTGRNIQRKGEEALFTLCEAKSMQLHATTNPLKKWRMSCVSSVSSALIQLKYLNCRESEERQAAAMSEHAHCGFQARAFFR